MNIVIWDWNGTLLDDVWTGSAAMNALLQKYHLPPLRDTAHYREVFCFPVSAYYDKLGVGGDLFPVTSHEWMDEYYAREEKCTLREGAMKALQVFRDAGWRQVILSASKLDNLTRQVQRYGILPYFDAILGLDHIYATSKVDIGREWLKYQQVSPENCVMIGDTLHDAEVAQALSCRCILADGGHQARHVLDTAGCEIADGVLDAALRALGGK